MMPESLRYSAMDAYTLEEIRRRYQNSTARGRIRLLKRCRPDEIMRMALEDSHVEVREWLARNVWEGDVLRRLSNDKDPFVRACAFENRFLGRNRDDFRKASHLEQLAYFRNHNVMHELVESVFDLDNQNLGVDFQSRQEFAAAFLTNEALRWSDEGYFEERMRSSREGWLVETHDYGEKFKKLFSKLWKLASKWPKESGIPEKVYRYVGTDDESKARVYAACGDPDLRSVILENCVANRHPETLRLGLNDPDGGCYDLAKTQLDLALHLTEQPWGLELLRVWDEHWTPPPLVTRGLTWIGLLILWRVWPLACVSLVSLFGLRILWILRSKRRQRREHNKRVWDEYERRKAIGRP